jgi:predicted DNA-binding transcriptional regulator YafY
MAFYSNLLARQETFALLVNFPQTKANKMDYSDKIDILRVAITENKQVLFQYKAEEKTRLINPHCTYIDKHSNSKLDAFQMSGQTSTNNAQFKQFFIRDMYNLQLTNSTFEEHELFNYASDRYINAICRIGG